MWDMCIGIGYDEALFQPTAFFSVLKGHMGKKPHFLPLFLLVIFVSLPVQIIINLEKSYLFNYFYCIHCDNSPCTL